MLAYLEMIERDNPLDRIKELEGRMSPEEIERRKREGKL